jgi:hypothetical protein
MGGSTLAAELGGCFDGNGPGDKACSSVPAEDLLLRWQSGSSQFTAATSQPCKGKVLLRIIEPRAAGGVSFDDYLLPSLPAAGKFERIFPFCVQMLLNLYSRILGLPMEGN